MKLILLEKVQNVGDLGDTVDVKPGFGRNFLVPQGKAIPATRENVALFEARRVELEAAANERLSQAEGRAGSMVDVAIEISANASEEGKLFGSIGPREIADAVSALGHPLNKSEVVMGEGPIRHTGEFDIPVHLHADVETIVKVTVVPEA
jgi:large subunit ribosomal protein L9